ncbi:thrombospondin type-1 domain-containing protein 4 isoform X2 [Astyanax mexicanus]|uniref:thrombospondin type-1 domain-containing protein 4 isoform X2 n=1 Tax=Astyanax mexicanus TaxID=7994 RepID=UPI0020CB4C77|nr:thrombospondin type-1 domain-containing protein 4 isoform X2 [Astyanax mexicanus]
MSRRVSMVSFAMVMALLWSIPTDCQLPADHKKVSPRSESQPGVNDDVPQGSWGSWGPWGECSRSCGGGVHQQTRPCLPTVTPLAAAYTPRQAPHVGHQEPGHVESALRPSVPVHRGNTHLTSRGQPRKQQNEVRPGRRRSSSRITPGMYGYGKMPYVMSSQSDQNIHTNLHQYRPPSDYRHHSYRRQQQQQQLNNRNTHQITHHNSHHNTNQQTWVPLYQPSSGLQSQTEQQYPTGTQTSGSSQTSTQTRPYNPLPASSCSGESSLYKKCNTNPCPPASKPVRDVQCSSHNSHPFMGRLYEWEPFNEVPEDQLCELNCRAIGYRFYVRLSERVIDGTPCGQNETSICVAGKCQSPGCDEFLGSGKEMDKCGVCGGDNTACKLVSGMFQHSLSKVGYHKIVEIPEGATKINVTEMVKSQNYLALRSRAGRSIINGNWAIDRPGKYEGGGTMFTYRRPNEISSTAGESFLAEGPTNEVLDVYMIYQQPNPGVHYEYILPSENSVLQGSADDGNTVTSETGYDQYGRTSQEGYEQGGGHRYPPHTPDNQVPAAQPPRRQREHNWKLIGTTDCSASCGRGSRYTVFGCVHRITHDRVSDTLCDSSTKPSAQEEPCNVQPCPAFWDIGEWSECSKTCGLGMQHRQILCRQVYANRTLNVQSSRCRHLERPESSGTCQMKICSEWQIRSEWSPCSVPCGVGQRSREVRCVSNVGDFVEDEECNMKLRPSDAENCDMGPCAKSWFHTDWANRCSAECGMGVRSRSVVCLINHISSLPLEGCGSERPPEVQACNNRPCESRTEWFTGPWGQCSAECGTGSQQRAVVCLMKSDEGYNVMPPYECSSLDKPLGQQSCHMKACGAKWYYTSWSACSKTCEGGFRVREVRCLSDEMTPSEGCEEGLKPEEKEECNTQPCVPQIDENCRDKYFNCNVVGQARLCVYNYYKMACCASCTRVAQRQSASRSYR